MSQADDDEAKIALLESAFARGDYARVKRDAMTLAESTKNDDVRARALKLSARLKPDPIAIVLFIIAAILLIALTTYFEIRARP